MCGMMRWSWGCALQSVLSLILYSGGERHHRAQEEPGVGLLGSADRPTGSRTTGCREPLIIKTPERQVSNKLGDKGISASLGRAVRAFHVCSQATIVTAVQSLSHVQLCNSMNCSMPGFPVLHCLLEPAQIHVHWVSYAIQPSNPLSPLLLLPRIFPSIRIFSNESALLTRLPKYRTFSFSVSPSNEYSGFISFRIDWLDLLAAQGILKSLLQHHSSKASILWCSALFMVQHTHQYTATEKTIALIIQTFVGKVISLFFNMLPPRFVIVFLPKSKHLLILWLQSLSTVILESKKIKSVTVSTFPPSICHKVMGLDAMIFIFWMFLNFSLGSNSLICIRLLKKS